jgi:hypothetical protein
MPAEAKTEDIFCYRRDDSAGDTGRFHDRLALEFGDKYIFMYVDGIRLSPTSYIP